MGDKVLRIDNQDNVVVLLKSLKSGTIIENCGERIELKQDIAVGHKLACSDIRKGEKVIKYGFPIGVAITDIHKGDWVHLHNLRTSLKEKESYNYNPSFSGDEEKNNGGNLSKDISWFMGYKRDNGQVGIRNEIWLIPTVGCINKLVEKMAILGERRFSEDIDKGSIDGIHAFTHPYGCSQLGEDLLNTQKILAGLVKHPNAAGVLLLGLGCENNIMADLQKLIGTYNEDRVKFLKLQELEDELDTGLAEIAKLVKHAKEYKKNKVPVSKLKIGLKCGGSDAFSGITANPLLGKISNMIIEMGGTTILTEVPEMFGAEKILMDRAENEAIFEKTVNLINKFKDYFMANEQPVYENPSPGNKEGGITTLEEKALGCTQKGGSSIVRGVSFYGEQIEGKGLQILEGPGNDLVSTTALTAAGAQLILFTTGRGTPFGAPVPTVKISTNTALDKRKPGWIDFDAGRLLANFSIDQLTDELFQYILGLASGEIKTNNEINDYREIAIFKTGVTL